MYLLCVKLSQYFFMLIATINLLYNQQKLFAYELIRVIKIQSYRKFIVTENLCTQNYNFRILEIADK